MTTLSPPKSADPSATRRAGQRRMVWWLTPWALIGMMITPTILLAWLTSADDYQRYWRYPKIADGKTVVWVASLAIAMVIPMVIVAQERLRNRSYRTWDFTPREIKILRRCLVQLFGVTVIGYGIWLAMGTANGFSFGQLSGVGSTYDPMTAQQQFEGVAGITTMVQFGIATAVVGSLLWPYARYYEKAITVIVVVAAPIRSLMVSERLAAVEVILPVCVIFIARAYMSRSAPVWRRAAIRLLPLVAVPTLIVGFTMYESTRSWEWYKTNTDQTNLWSFGFHRLVGYYTTAYGNAELLRDGNWPKPGALPYLTLNAVWQAPVLNSFVSYSELTGQSFNYTSFGAQSEVTNREFNNTGGITSFTLDFGTAGGLLAAGVFGAIMACGYAAFAQARRWGLLFYPIFTTGLLELSRIFYIGAGRTSPALAGVLYVAIRLRKARRQDAKWGLGPRPAPATTLVPSGSVAAVGDPEVAPSSLRPDLGMSAGATSSAGRRVLR